MTKTTYQHQHDGMLYTRTSHRDYHFIAICAGGYRVTWHATQKSAEASARRNTAIRQWPVNSTTGEPYTDAMAGHLISRGVVLKMEVVGHHPYIVEPINHGKEV